MYKYACIRYSSSFSTVEGEAGANLVRRATGSVVQSLRIQKETERGLHTRSKSLRVPETQKSNIIDLRLHKGGRIEVCFGRDFKSDAVGGILRIIDGLSTRLDIWTDAMIVAGGENLAIVQSVECDSIFRGIETKGSRIARNPPLSHVVRGLPSKQESIAANDGVSGEGGALEYIEDRARMYTGLLVYGIKKRVLPAFDGVKGARDIKFQAFRNLVLKFELGTEYVGSIPRLCKDKTLLVIGIFGLDVTEDDGGPRVLVAGNFERDIRRSLSLYFK